MYTFGKRTQQQTRFPLWISGTLRIWSYGIYRQQNSIQKFMLMFESKHSFWVNKETFLYVTTSGQIHKSWPHNINWPIYTKYHQNKTYKIQVNERTGKSWEYQFLCNNVCIERKATEKFQMICNQYQHNHL